MGFRDTFLYKRNATYWFGRHGKGDNTGNVTIFVHRHRKRSILLKGE